LTKTSAAGGLAFTDSIRELMKDKKITLILLILSKLKNLLNDFGFSVTIQTQ